jgi:hypothetical protein
MVKEENPMHAARRHTAKAGIGWLLSIELMTELFLNHFSFCSYINKC